MSLTDFTSDRHLKRIIAHPEEDHAIWRADLERFLSGGTTPTRKSTDTAGIAAVQRLLIFLGYSTSSNGAFAIGGDFQRGTNRRVAQFLVENSDSRSIDPATLCYPCRWSAARMFIIGIPDARLTPASLEKNVEWLTHN